MIHLIHNIYLNNLPDKLDAVLAFVEVIPQISKEATGIAPLYTVAILVLPFLGNHVHVPVLLAQKHLWVNP